jgi:hypothetical protein
MYGKIAPILAELANQGSIGADSPAIQIMQQLIQIQGALLEEERKKEAEPGRKITKTDLSSKPLGGMAR